MKDLIERQAAIDVINESNSPIAEYLIGEIMALPSAQPECAKDFVMLKVIDLNGRPYYSIIYLENGNEFEGYSSYDLKVISEYLKRYFGFAQPKTHDKRTEMHACDLISRAAVIDEIVNTVSEIGLHDNSEVARYGATFRQHEIIDIIEGMPSAQPSSSRGHENDTISRRAAIDAVHKNYDVILDFTSDGQTISSSIEDILSELPSAQPKSYREGYQAGYKDAQSKTAERIAETAQNVSDEDLISRKAAIDAIRASTSKYTGFMEMEMYTDDDAVEAIEALPSAQPPVLTCDGCRHVGTYDTDFPCSGCIRREKDYYEQER